MNEPFLLELTFRNKNYEFPAAFQRYGFTYRISINISDTTYTFEPNEEGSYRVTNTSTQNLAVPDVGLLRAIAERLQKL